MELAIPIASIGVIILICEEYLMARFIFQDLRIYFPSFRCLHNWKYLVRTMIGKADFEQIVSGTEKLHVQAFRVSGHFT